MTSRAFFYFLYRSAYFLLFVVLLALLLITPADAIIRSYNNGQKYNIIILAVIYIATVLIVVFVYALRLFLNKSVLAAIPKSWVPVDKPDLKRHVYEMISAGLSKSAAIAYWSRPRVLERGEDGKIVEVPEPLRHVNTVETTRTSRTSIDVRVKDVARPVWGEIDHPGWASPNSPDLPNLQFGMVLSELPNLIEAKALTLAPIDPTLSPSMAAPVLDMESIALLQRPLHAGLRQYVEHLVELGLLELDAVTGKFVDLYEYARFSNRPISNGNFREIMRLFAEVLRSLGTADQGSILEEEDEEDNDDNNPHRSAYEMADDASSRIMPSTPRSKLSRTTTGSSQGSVRHPARRSSANTWHQYLTAENTPRSRRTEMLSRRSSNNSFAQSKRPYPRSQPSSASLRSKMSAASSSSSSYGSVSASGSVIRLATVDDNHDLPYILSMRETGPA